MIGWIFGAAAGVPYGCAEDAVELPKAALGAPKTAEPKDRGLHVRWKGRLELCAVNMVPIGNLQRFFAPGQASIGARHHRFLK